MGNNYDDENDRKVSGPKQAEKMKAGAAGAGIGIGAIVVIIIIAVAAFFMFNGKRDTPASVTQDAREAAGTVYGATADVAKEVPQAGSDAVTPGDQPTTRPNADGSSAKLDQK